MPKRTSTEGFDDLFVDRVEFIGEVQELKSRDQPIDPPPWPPFKLVRTCAFSHDFGDPEPDEKYGGTVQTCKKCGDKFHQSEPRFYENEAQLDV